jgi:hypothetical protein
VGMHAHESVIVRGAHEYAHADGNDELRKSHGQPRP